MGRPLRFIPESSLVEVTVRTLQGRYLFKPSPGWREIFVGLLARAQERYPLQIHAFACLSNHFHLLVTPEDAYQLAGFMRYFNTNLSKEAGRLHGWRGTLIERRYKSILISEETRAQISRLRYVLSQGVKEGLVAKVAQWPGPHCYRGLVAESPLQGIWYDRTRENKARQKRRSSNPAEHSTKYQLYLAPLPCWRNEEPEKRRRLVVEMVETIESKARADHRTMGTRTLGLVTILQQHPHHKPQKLQWSPAVLVHAATREARIALLQAYKHFLSAFNEAVERLRAGEPSARFPLGSFPPALQVIRAGPI